MLKYILAVSFELIVSYYFEVKWANFDLALYCQAFDGLWFGHVLLVLVEGCVY